MTKEPSPKPDPDASMSEFLVNELQRRILIGDIPVRSWLRHVSIAEEYGTSRTPVREALRVLDSQGIVTIVRNRGAQVNGHSARDIRELGEVRSALEGLAAELAAERIDDDQLERLLNAWNGYREAIEGFVGTPAPERTAQNAARWVEANNEFHSVILEAADNRQLEISLDDIGRRLPRNTAYSAYSGDSRLLRKNVDEHEAIARAIADRNGPAARKAMMAHIRSSAATVARWLDSSSRGRHDA